MAEHETKQEKTISVVLSLTLSLVLLQATVTITDGYDLDKYLHEKAVADLMLTDSRILTSMGEAEFDDITPQVRKDVESLDGVTETGSVYMQEIRHHMDDAHVKRVREAMAEYGQDMSAVMTEQAESYLDQNEILGHVYGVDGIAEDKMEIAGKENGDFDREKFASGDYVIVTAFTDIGDGEFYHIGEKVTIDFESGRSKTYEVLAIGDVPYALGPQHGHGVAIYFTLPAEEFVRQTGETSAMSIACNFTEAGEAKAEAWVKTYCEEKHPKLSYVSKSTIQGEFYNLTQMTMVVGGILSFILGLIGILNFINTMITSIQARKNELAVLQAVGMTGRQLRQMLTGEGLCYVLLTAGMTLTVGNLLVYAIVKAYTAQMWMFTYHFVIWPILAAVPAMLLIGLVISAACCSILRKRSIIERLRAE